MRAKPSRAYRAGQEAKLHLRAIGWLIWAGACLLLIELIACAVWSRP